MGGNQPITQDNRNPLLGRVAGADGLKTGHTDEAGYGFTGSAEQNGRRIIMVVAGLASFNQRIEELVQVHGMGLQRLEVAAAASPGPADRRGAGPARRRRRTVGLVAPRNHRRHLSGRRSAANIAREDRL